MTNSEFILALLLLLSLAGNAGVLYINDQQKQEHELFKVEVNEEIKHISLQFKAFEDVINQLPVECLPNYNE